ncbi:hypothetical protein ACIBG7_26945 [Nonomuraea sp. NPDC050328]|uniref:hypothetical protein n=1 Tax=Nonomuraea sp. NPDC050328 TaxID=3364361 RepID=UPI0037A16F6C
MQIVYWNDGINWNQVFTFAMKVSEIYQGIAGAVGDGADATDIVLPTGKVYSYSAYVQTGSGGGDRGGTDCIYPKE